MISPENEPSVKLAARLRFTPFRDTELPDGAAVRLFDVGDVRRGSKL